jgi:predicted  nucleic acid-binding Zn-ribbon protein
LDPVQTIINALILAGLGGAVARLTHNLRQEVNERITELRDDIAGIEGKLGGLRTELKADIADLRADLREIRSDIGEVRSDLTRVALAVGAQPRASQA